MTKPPSKNSPKSFYATFSELPNYLCLRPAALCPSVWSGLMGQHINGAARCTSPVPGPGPTQCALLMVRSHWCRRVVYVGELARVAHVYMMIYVNCNRILLIQEEY